jgi:hypothetical protein
MMILGREIVVPPGVAVVGLSENEAAGSMFVSIVILGAAGVDDTGGDGDADDAPPGKGFRTAESPVGRGLRAGLAVMLSVEERGDASLGVPDGRAVLLPFGWGTGWPIRSARRLGFLVFSVTIRRERSPPGSGVGV